MQKQENKMLFNLLATETTSAVESTSGGNSANGGFGTVMYVVLGVFLVILIVVNVLSNKKRKAQMEAEKEKRNAIKPGYRVMTIGGIVGTVVAVDDEANTFVLQTGTDETPNYIKFDKVAIYSSENPDEATVEQDFTADENTATAENETTGTAENEATGTAENVTTDETAHTEEAQPEEKTENGETDGDNENKE